MISLISVESFVSYYFQLIIKSQPYSPISSFHNSGLASIKFSIRLMHSSFCRFTISTPCCFINASAPGKVLFSPMITFLMPNCTTAPAHESERCAGQVRTSVLRRAARRRTFQHACGSVSSPGPVYPCSLASRTHSSRPSKLRPDSAMHRPCVSSFSQRCPPNKSV